VSHFRRTHFLKCEGAPSDRFGLPSNDKSNGTQDGKIQSWTPSELSRTVSTSCYRKRNAHVADFPPAVPTQRRLRPEQRTSTVVRPAARKPLSRWPRSPDGRFSRWTARAARMVRQPLHVSMRPSASAARCASLRAPSTPSSAAPSECMRCCHRFALDARFAFHPVLSIASSSSPSVANGLIAMPSPHANASSHATAASRAASGSPTGRAPIDHHRLTTIHTVGRCASRRLLRALEGEEPH
jgi:hypothetical protein